ncbi:hypothetical protein M527_16090 [Sphingobium indicum IP26]|uniref:Uncharacterized protein n=1 Tax=Sphingobium indicum F2 TaxID=1450518 RepID=A0A8E1C3T6_9SPHN|nr:hypothetical protein [Sphingobium indicum]EPR17577.1 hypothetical protein M527_16090 [Sphingobium indicum IP26]KER37627.1 hypothetical protein AL00_04235 [Sphingobium indicum F2]
MIDPPAEMRIIELINTGKLVRRGALLVRPSSGKPISPESANEALDRSREHDIGSDRRLASTPNV